jgi:hypothetical protein
LPDDASVEESPSTSRPDASPPTPPGMTRAVVLDDCGPTDGPAYLLRVGPVPLVCSIGQNVPRDEIIVWDRLPTAPTTVVVRAGANGEARSCAGATCVDAVSATIQFTSITATEARGTYEMAFKAGSSKSGTFAATLCRNGAMCG